LDIFSERFDSNFLYTIFFLLLFHFTNSWNALISILSLATLFAEIRFFHYLLSHTFVSFLISLISYDIIFISTIYLHDLEQLKRIVLQPFYLTFTFFQNIGIQFNSEKWPFKMISKNTDSNSNSTRFLFWVIIPILLIKFNWL